jgi:branched-chain amino acid transport system substrate-binding protein
VRLLLAVGLGLALVACSDDGAPAPTTSVVTSTTTTVPERPDDGVLVVGMLLPETGEGAALGQGLTQAVLDASEAINDAGGVLGQPVEIVGPYDEGDDPATAREAIAELLEQDVDAVIGPASSNIALATLGDLMRAEVLTCSPTATALALDSFPNRSLFFRTAPSDSLQAAAIAAEAERTGAVTASVIYLDDGYGRPLAEATMDALQSRGIEVPNPVGFSAEDESLLDESTTAETDEPGVIVVLGDAEQGVRMLSNLADLSGVEPGQYQPTIIVNDSLRRPPSTQEIVELPREIRDRIIGLSPAATSDVAGLTSAPFAANARDCLVLIALAASRAESDAPAEIATYLSDVSDGGVSCRDFAECLSLVAAGRNVDYGAPGGDVELGAAGDPTSYRFERWRFDEEGLDVPITVPTGALLPPS